MIFIAPDFADCLTAQQAHTDSLKNCVIDDNMISFVPPYLYFASSHLAFSHCLASKLKTLIDATIDCKTEHVMMQCATPFGASKLISPEDISSEILISLRISAQDYLKRRPVRDAHCGGERLHIFYQFSGSACSIFTCLK